MGKSKIEWTQDTWNPVRGCTKVSPGCKFCYAETFAERFRGVPGHPYEQGFDLRLVTEKLEEPLRWRAPRRIFVNSMSDLFHEDVPVHFIAAAFGVMGLACHHTYQVLTKRADRAREVLSKLTLDDCINASLDYNIGLTNAQSRAIAAALPPGSPFASHGDGPLWPLPNVWMGVSVEDQKRAEERIPLLIDTPAAIRWVSAEPLLGPVSFDEWIGAVSYCDGCETEHVGSRVPDPCQCGKGGGLITTWGARQLERLKTGERYANNGPGPGDDGPQLHWVVVGGESGHGARPFDLAWARSLVAQCKEAGVACFVKQLGARPVDDPERWQEWRAVGASMADFGDPKNGRHAVVVDDRKGGDIAEWPEDLRVRQFPEVRA